MKGGPFYVDNCASFDQTGKCVSCETGYTWTDFGDDQRYHCTKIIPGCSKYGPTGSCVTCETGRTINYNVQRSNVCRCAPGYQTVDGGVTCVAASSSVPNCLELISAYSCKRCRDGFYLDGEGGGRFAISFVCKSCSDLFGSTCKKCERRAKGLVYCTQS